MNQFIIDTTVFVEYFRQNSVAKDFFEKNTLTFSIVSRAELIQGARNKNELGIIIRFCKNLEQLPINEKISTKAVQLMEKFYHSHGLLFLDALIAATALDENLIFVTDNIKHFSFIPDLKLKDWKSI
jgi:predicted nucleic acid-binding protein